MKILKKGSKGPDVGTLQTLLNAKLIPSPKLVVDQDFGNATDAAVRAFQKQKSLVADGVVGPNTWTALGQSMVGYPSDPHSPPPPPPPANSPSNSSAPWMSVAEAELGVSENSLPGEHNKRIIEYHSATSLQATTDETPWCSSFVNWVMKQSGYTGTNSALAKSWMNWGKAITEGKPGAIVVIQSKSASGNAATGSSTGYHVAFFVSKDSSKIRLLGGNQGDQVKYSNFYLSSYDVKGYRWPS